MPNNVIYNLFSKDEIESIKNILFLKESEILLDEPQLGRNRFVIPITLIKKQIIKKVYDQAKIFLKSPILVDCQYSEYNLKYGNPELSVHTDTRLSTFTIDYQLDSNCIWPIYVEGKPFSLENNQALTINVNEQAHWRPKRKFSEGEYVKMIFFHFNDLSGKKPKILNANEQEKLRSKWNHLWDLEFGKNNI